MVKKLVNDVHDFSNVILESVTHSLPGSKFISSRPNASALDVGKLRNIWSKERVEFVKRIDQLTKVNIDLNWQFLINPHSHWLVLKALTSTSIQMLPPLRASVFRC